jgi:hypothetical protein
MSLNSINCPNCGAAVEISEVLYRRAQSEISAKWEQQTRERIEQAALSARQAERAAIEQELGALKQKLEIGTQYIEEARQKERALQQKALQIEQQKANLEAELTKRLRLMVGPLRDQLKAKMAEESSLEVVDLKNQLAEQASKLQQSHSMELEYRQRVRALEDEKRELDVVVQRKVDEQRQAIEQSLRQTYAEQSDLKLKEKDQVIERLKQAVDELKRKSEQGSVELQGEVLELDIEDKLRRAFPQDVFNAVARGVRGADLLHTVRNRSLQECGTVLWEVKNSKNWSSNWIAKLKEDQREAGANLAALVSISLPREISHFDVIEGVFVCSHECVLPVAACIRERLEHVMYIRESSQARKEKTEIIFDYIAGDEFRHKVEAIIEAFDRMKVQLDRERRAMERQWKEREKLLEIVMTNTSRMYGDIRGIAGGVVKEIVHLELDADPDLIEQAPDSA